MLIQKECPALVFVALSLLLLAGCNNNEGNSPQNYSLNKPHQMALGKPLNEISGIFYDAEDSSLLAVADSKEKVFQISLRTKKLKDFTKNIIPSNSDLEDIVRVDSSLFLLMSKGILVEVPVRGADSSNIKTHALNLSGTNDFETVYYDPSAQGLVLLCKTCAREKGSGVRTAFRFDLRTRTFDSASFYTISRGQVKRLMKNEDAKFEPSAAAFHPLNKRLYILSSAGNLLVIADNRGQVIEAYDLNPDVFPQAEGIAFAPNGDMYISNEGKGGKPTLLLFENQQNQRKK